MYYPQAKVGAISQAGVAWLSKFIALAGIATVLPFFIHIQWVTGPIINAILILTVIIVGIRSAMLIALIPSLIALGSGLLPGILAPAVPFIMISNVILVLCVDWFWRNRKNDFKSYWSGVLLGSALKFLFLYFSISLVVELVIKTELATAIAQMMGYMQLVTAIAGGVIAWVIIKFLKFVR